MGEERGGNRPTTSPSPDNKLAVYIELQAPSDA